MKRKMMGQINKQVLIFVRIVFVVTLFFHCHLPSAICHAQENERPVDVTSGQMEMLEKGKVIHFMGNVKVVQENSVLYADKVWQYLEDDRLEAEGNVHYQETKNKEVTDIYGGKMVFNRKADYGVVTINPKVMYKDAENPKNSTEITGDKIEVFQKEKRALITNNVIIVQPEAKATSEKAEYFFETKKLILTGNPWVWQKTEDSIGEYRGQVITLFTENKRVVIEENVQAKITPIKKEPEK